MLMRIVPSSPRTTDYGLRLCPLLFVMLLLGCSDAKDVIARNPDGGGGGGAGGAGAGGLLMGSSAGDGGEQIGGGCSGDLKQVVDQSGNVVETCPADKGCSGGKCIPACQAAADSHGS